MCHRALIFDVARDEKLGHLTEGLKWGEPSYATKKGSPIRMDWKPKKPNQISLYFNCKTTLIETFKEVYKDTFEFSGNREIVLLRSNSLLSNSLESTVLKPKALQFNLDSIPMLELKGCISMALRYHSIKHLSLLGE